MVSLYGGHLVPGSLDCYEKLRASLGMEKTDESLGLVLAEPRPFIPW